MILRWWHTLTPLTACDSCTDPSVQSPWLQNGIRPHLSAPPLPSCQHQTKSIYRNCLTEDIHSIESYLLLCQNILFIVYTLLQWLWQLLITRLSFLMNTLLVSVSCCHIMLLPAQCIQPNNASFHSGKIWSLWELHMHISSICVHCAPSSTRISSSVQFASGSIALSVWDPLGCLVQLCDHQNLITTADSSFKCILVLGWHFCLCCVTSVPVA